MEAVLGARARLLEEAQRLLARTRRKLTEQTQKDLEVLGEDAFVLYALEDCELRESLLYAKKYVKMPEAAVQEELQRRLLETPLEELSKAACVDGTRTPAVSKRCALFHEGYQIAALVRRLNDDVGIAPSWVGVSGATKQREERALTVIRRTSSENEKQKKRRERWRAKWAGRVSKVTTQLGGNAVLVTAKVGHFCGHEAGFWLDPRARSGAQNVCPEPVPLLLRVNKKRPRKRAPSTHPPVTVFIRRGRDVVVDVKMRRWHSGEERPGGLSLEHGRDEFAVVFWRPERRGNAKSAYTKGEARRCQNKQR